MSEKLRSYSPGFTHTDTCWRIILAQQPHSWRYYRHQYYGPGFGYDLCVPTFWPKLPQASGVNYLSKSVLKMGIILMGIST